MATVTDSLAVAASVGWSQSKTVSGFESCRQGPESLSFTARPSAATYTEVLLATGTIAAGANTTVDLYSITNAFGEAKTITKALTLLIKATGSTGQLKIEPGASNAITWFFGGTTPSITLDCGTSGCAILIADGATHTVSATDRNIKLSNPGSATITYYVAALLGA